MNAQVISSLFAGILIALAAFMLHSPGSVLALALVCMVAWWRHSPELSVSFKRALTTLGLVLGGFIIAYLLLLLLR